MHTSGDVVSGIAACVFYKFFYIICLTVVISRHSKVHHSMNLSTINDETPPVSTARLIVTSHAIKKYKQQITCYCMDVSIKEKSAGLVVSMKPGGHQSISSM